MRLHSTGESVLQRRASWPNTTYTAIRDFITVPNLVGLLGCGVLLLLFLVPPLPWNIRLPLYLMVLVWTILRPRVALYLLPFCVPWGSLDYIDVSALRLASADILTVFALVGTMVLSMTVAISIKSSLKEIRNWLEVLAIVLSGSQYLRTRRQIWMIIVLV